jgi:formamidopyrimidine-DNA glycosylase
MPELPEVETVMRGLRPAMERARIRRVLLRRPDLRFPLPPRFAERLEGERVLLLRRRAKYILADLAGGDVLLLHLGMSGRFHMAAAGGARRGQIGAFTHATGNDPAHDHVVFELANGMVVTYNDPRRFGAMDLFPVREEATHRLLAGLGPEPLGDGFTPEVLAHRAAGRRADLKSFLLDQRTVAGLGNIYVSEALHRAGLSPRRAARALANREGGPTAAALRLVPVVRAVLEEAILAGGSTLKDFRHADGTLGYFQHAFAVYDRAGEACAAPGCTGTIRRLVQAGRATFYCPRCQR